MATLRTSGSSTFRYPDPDRAATEAVRQWQDTQTLLNCTPVEVRNAGDHEFQSPAQLASGAACELAGLGVHPDRSPSLMNRGTRISRAVSSVASFVTLPLAVSLCAPEFSGRDRQLDMGWELDADRDCR